MQGWGKRDISYIKKKKKKNQPHRPAASSGSIPTCENPGAHFNKVYPNLRATRALNCDTCAAPWRVFEPRSCRPAGATHVLLCSIIFARVRKTSSVGRHFQTPEHKTQAKTSQSSGYWSLSCVFIGCCYPITGSYVIRRVFPCKSAIGSEASRAGLINCDPIAKLGSPLVDDRSILNSVKYRVVSCVVWTNRKSVSSNTDTNRTGVLAVVDIDYAPHTYAIRVQFLVESLADFGTWESCWAMLLMGGFSRGSPLGSQVLEGIGHGLCLGPNAAFVWSDFWKPLMAGPGIEPGSTRMRVQRVTTAPPRSVVLDEFRLNESLLLVFISCSEQVQSVVYEAPVGEVGTHYQLAPRLHAFPRRHSPRAGIPEQSKQSKGALEQFLFQREQATFADCRANSRITSLTSIPLDDCLPSRGCLPSQVNGSQTEPQHQQKEEIEIGNQGWQTLLPPKLVVIYLFDGIAPLLVSAETSNADESLACGCGISGSEEDFIKISSAGTEGSLRSGKPWKLSGDEEDWDGELTKDVRDSEFHARRGRTESFERAQATRLIKDISVTFEDQKFCGLHLLDSATGFEGNRNKVSKRNSKMDVTITLILRRDPPQTRATCVRSWTAVAVKAGNTRRSPWAGSGPSSFDDTWSGIGQHTWALGPARPVLMIHGAALGSTHGRGPGPAR
ncbi:hypothetical protein PR048_027325 [Dryococelus australis]|uniref:Uncharacterized protein n=1 Tax=Dryococelus australis TaxID=614101 RepID=A0ABQ9GFK7_9NEOP|nr:hypothetical protein PR048_027325 [Dryococelus australis]